MKKVRLGKTELMVSKIAFGGIPIQRLNRPDAVKVVRGAIDLGVNFIDTANGYTDSEEKIGETIANIPRDSVIIASKSGARDKETFLKHVDLSLERLGVDYIDVYQHHNVSTHQQYDDIMGEGGAFEGMMEAVRVGKVRFPAFSSHSVQVALRIMREGKFTCVQLPFNYVDDEVLKEAVPLAKELDMGFIAMKPFGGGLLSDAGLSIRYLSQFESVVPDPGIERLSEIEEIVRIAKSEEKLSAEDEAAIARIKKEMGDSWCHRCGYCLPCPQNIHISTALNSKSAYKRMPYSRAFIMLNETMERARGCIGCRECVSRCPYNLDIPALIAENILGWEKYLAENS